MDGAKKGDIVHGDILHRQKRIHVLKTVNPYFEWTWQGVKLFDIRKADRDYGRGDTLVLKEYDAETDAYSGRFIEATVSCIYGYDHFPAAIVSGHVVMGLSIKWRDTEPT